MSSDLIRKKLPLGITVLKLKRILIFVIFMDDRAGRR